MTSKSSIFLILILTWACSGKGPNKVIELPALISDHLVLQQQDTISITGTTMKGGSISFQADWGNKQQAQADADGKWTIEFVTPAAGGPYNMEFSTGDTTITIADVFIGEVWLASGQSNMEMPLKGWPPNDTINNSVAEIRAADYPMIRMFTVEKAMSDTLVDDVKGSWAVCSPRNAGDFSATAYFFARKLNQALGLPVGIIHSSWGGTPAESWVSKEGLKPLGDFNDVLKRLEVTPEEHKKIREWTSKLVSYDLKMEDLANATLKDEKVPAVDFDDSAWKVMKLPMHWEQSEMGEFDGIVWFRKKITLEQEPAGEHKISLGPIDDMDITYVNGVKVGSILQDGNWQTNREYVIPEGTLKKGDNIIAVKVFDSRGGGGLWGDPGLLYLQHASGKKTDISGEWKYLPVAEFRNNKLYELGIENSLYLERPSSLLNISPYTPTILFNAMINPLKYYTIKGAIWYQGESNVARDEQYFRLFPALIQDWRKEFNNDFPFYFVQIAPYVYQGGQESKSAALRDVQRKTLSLSKTGMVVTTDIGNPTNIHPANKKDVGERLANWALAQTYSLKVPYSGPLYKEMMVKGNEVTVMFEHGEGLTTKNGKLTGFEVAGADGVFYPASAKTEQQGVVVSSPKVKQPVAVRYGWSDVFEATLFNGDGLPASPFLGKAN